jgi:uncharacterized phiE125 gp8 family phage protein
MHNSLQVVTGPTTEPVSLTEAKAWLRVDTSDQDTMISDIIAGARDYCEKYTGRALVTQTLAARWDAFPEVIKLPRFPVASVTSIQYVDSDGTTQTLASTEYTTDIYSQPARITPAYGKSWPTTRDQVNAVTVTFVGGGAAAAVAPAIRIAMRMLIAHWFDNPSAVITGSISAELELTVKSLLATEILYL